MPRVAVLLATYNGAAWLPEQLESLAAQQGVEWRLLWRDDASRDASRRVLQDFAARHPGRVEELGGPAGRLGATAGFLALLRAAPAADAYAFMDQDDVWLPAKLARGLARLEAGADAVCGRLSLADGALRPRGLSALPRMAPGFASLLAHNVAAGCTMMLSPRAREWALTAPPPPGSLHDWWAALLVTGMGGRLDFDPEPMIRYRLHGGNSVGGAPGLLERARRALGRGGAAWWAMLEAHLAALAPLPLAPGPREVVRLLAGLRGAGPLARLRLRARAGLRHHSRAGDALLTAWLLRG
ncbi:glycosyltransferase [Rhodovarius lipocyclicus]|uniref:glycosyltransferase n=1 Tax=Rhodovarius lipocyclicus TaxID=268410 RepID=UPI0013568971|nr:glycosyltransferase [Rhodovarius lipocyclicus]